MHQLSIDQKNDNITISLQDLQMMDNTKDIKPQQTSSSAIFDIYNTINNTLLKCLLVAIDTNQIPKLPIRRPSCKKLQCIYEYAQWKKNKQYEIYKICRCQTAKNQNKDFKIDFRLTSLLQKLTNIDEYTYKYNLYYTYGLLWICKIQTNQQQKLQTTHEVLYEDAFGHVEYNQFSQLQLQKVNLNDNNIRYFKNLLKINIQEYLTNKNDWQVSNLQEQCHEIVEKIMSFSSIQKVKNNLLLSSNFNLYSNMPSLKYTSPYLDILSTQKKKLNPDSIFNGCSNNCNERIMFYYCDFTKLMFIKNAQFFQGDGYSNLRAIPIINQYDQIDNQSKKSAVWFKDRKGDIFSIQKRQLFIYKFHLQTKCYKQIMLIQDDKLYFVKNAASLIYIPQKDTVYYFSTPDFRDSFYFELYRSKEKDDKTQKKTASSKISMNSCVSINIKSRIFQQKQVIRDSNICKAIYTIEKYRFAQKIGVQKEQLTPIIYLLVERPNNLPIKLGLYKLIFNPQDRKIFQFTSQGQTVNKDSTKDKMKLQSGIFGVLKDGQESTLFIQTLLNNHGVNYQGKLIQSNKGQKKVVWSQKLKEITAKKQIQLEKPKNKKQKDKKDNINYRIYNLPNINLSKGPSAIQKAILDSPQTILINDIAGLSLNNQIKFLGYLNKDRKIVEMSLNSLQGQIQWSIYHIT